MSKVLNIDALEETTKKYVGILERYMPTSKGTNGFNTVKNIDSIIEKSGAYVGSKVSKRTREEHISKIFRKIHEGEIQVYFLEVQNRSNVWFAKRKMGEAGQSENCRKELLEKANPGDTYTIQTLQELIMTFENFKGNLASANALASSFLNDSTLFKSVQNDEGIVTGLLIMDNHPAPENTPKVPSKIESTFDYEKLADMVAERIIERVFRK